MRYKEAEKWVFHKFITDIDDRLCYHDLKHTVDVIRAADRLCYMEGVGSRDAILIRTGALFHDIGFCNQYLDNEEIAAEIAADVLPQFGFSPIEIDKIEGIIMATRIPHQPNGRLEEIVCDADLDYLGREDFHPLADNLKRELMRYDVIKTDQEWDEIQVKFFGAHRFFTASARKLRDQNKMVHLQEIQKRRQLYPDYDGIR